MAAKTEPLKQTTYKERLWNILPPAGIGCTQVILQATDGNRPHQAIVDRNVLESPRPKKPNGELSQLTYNGKNVGQPGKKEWCKRLQAQLEGTQNYRLGEFKII